MRALFLVNGLGLGNATRCYAVLSRLAERGWDVEVATSGNGLWFLADRPEIRQLHPMEPLYYGSDGGRLSVWRTVGAARELWAIHRRNEAMVAGLLAARRPDVVVMDSVYGVCPVRSAGIPLVAINNADVVDAAYRRFEDRPASIRAQFHVVERNDMRFHRWMADLTVSPSLDPSLPAPGGPVRRVGPIVRSGYWADARQGPVRRVVVMLSGSVFGFPIELDRPIAGVQMDILGRDRPPEIPEVPGVTWHGKVRGTLPVLREADLAVVNGGFSAVSEMVTLRKPVIVVPVANHAEQWVNARTVQALGVGSLGREDRLREDIEAGLARVERWRAAYRALAGWEDGATQAADLIEGMARRRPSRSGG